MPLRMQICWDVLESAKANGDAVVVAACRRMIVAHRLGRKASRFDVTLILAFAE